MTSLPANLGQPTSPHHPAQLGSSKISPVIWHRYRIITAMFSGSSSFPRFKQSNSRTKRPGENPLGKKLIPRTSRTSITVKIIPKIRGLVKAGHRLLFRPHLSLSRVFFPRFQMKIEGKIMVKFSLLPCERRTAPKGVTRRSRPEPHLRRHRYRLDPGARCTTSRC